MTNKTLRKATIKGIFWVFLLGMIFYFLLSGPEWWLMQKGIMPRHWFYTINHPFVVLAKSTPGVWWFDWYLCKWYDPIGKGGRGIHPEDMSATQLLALREECKVLVEVGHRDHKVYWNPGTEDLPKTIESLYPYGVVVGTNNLGDIVQIALSSLHGIFVQCSDNAITATPTWDRTFIVTNITTNVFGYAHEGK